MAASKPIAVVIGMRNDFFLFGMYFFYC